MVECANHSSYIVSIFSLYTQSGFGRKSYGYLIGVKSSSEYMVAVSDQQRIDVKLKRICSCESTGSPNNEPQQFDKNGKVLRGKINKDDIGACQINLRWWGKESRRLGYDLQVKTGNEAMASYILAKCGTKCFNWSRSCWIKSP